MISLQPDWWLGEEFRGGKKAVEIKDDIGLHLDQLRSTEAREQIIHPWKMHSHLILSFRVKGKGGVGGRSSAIPRLVKA